MSALHFVTPSLIDLDAVFTFGVHAKETENPIGYFGTGLKFATATLLRTSHKVVIHRGNKSHRLTASPMMFREKEFHKVFLDDRDLGFTTDLGKNWEVWMAFRELESNTRDEGGFTTGRGDEAQEFLVQNPQTTIIEVIGDAILNAHARIDEIFCNSPVIASTPEIEVRAGRSKYLYYRGVSVATLQKPSQHTFNILDKMQLTEDRTLAEYSPAWQVGKRLAPLKDVAMLKTIMSSPRAFWEHDLDFMPSSPSEEFFQAYEAVATMADVNKSAGTLTRAMNRFEDKPVQLNDVQKQQLAKACAFLERLEYPVTKYPITVIELSGALGMAKNGTIYIHPSCFRHGTKFLAATILEEYLHLKEGVYDETRQMQNLLFDIIITLGERVTGEPI